MAKRKTFTAGEAVEIKRFDGKWYSGVYLRAQPPIRQGSRTSHWVRVSDGREWLLWPSEIRKAGGDK